MPSPTRKKPDDIIEAAADYRMIVEIITRALNPPDEATDEAVIMGEAVTRIAAYVEMQPCVCETTGDRPCGRCWALGRRFDQPIPR